MLGRRAGVGALIALAVFGAACGDDSPSRLQPSGVAGDWTGSWTSTAPAYGGTAALRASFAQDAAGQLTGTVIMVEHLCVSTLAAAGQVQGDRVSFELQGSLGDRTRFEGTIAPGGQAMAGTYAITGGFCRQRAGSDDGGTWSLARR